MDDRQGFSLATRLVFLLLALLPVWYLLHEHFSKPDELDTRAVTFTETVVRITVGFIGFLAVILLVHGGKRGRSSKPSKPSVSWFACPSCGQRVQRRSEEHGSSVTCGACNNEFELNPVAASTPDAGSEEDVKKWLEELTEQRQRSRRM
ncbi:MAG: hypothetical protein FJ271_05850 [Planctomycetes bacterium]|nr:hypothetical protein [Planctomycetota bacterium]